MNVTYKTKGTCSTAISLDLNDGVVTNVRFTGGCNGNTKGVAALVEGQKAEDIIARCEGIKCGLKPTSCPDQLAQAIRMAMEQEGK